MARNFAKGIYQVQNPAKYIGNKPPVFRSGWEMTFMQFCDNHDSIIQWASEPMRIPYFDPIGGKQTVYVPDFLVYYRKSDNTLRAELVEIKPMGQAMISENKRMKPHEQATVLKNHAKWKAAAQFCQNNNITFRVVTEQDIFHMGGNRKR